MDNTATGRRTEHVHRRHQLLSVDQATALFVSTTCVLRSLESVTMPEMDAWICLGDLMNAVFRRIRVVMDIAVRDRCEGTLGV